MIKFHGVKHLEPFEPLEPNIVPGSLVRHCEDPNSVGIVIGVEYRDRWLWAQVMWTKYEFDMYESVLKNYKSMVRNVAEQIQAQEDAELLKIMSAVSR